jgi:hypothetical protein
MTSVDEEAAGDSDSDSESELTGEPRGERWLGSHVCKTRRGIGWSIHNHINTQKAPVEF